MLEATVNHSFATKVAQKSRGSWLTVQQLTNNTEVKPNPFSLQKKTSRLGNQWKNKQKDLLIVEIQSEQCR